MRPGSLCWRRQLIATQVGSVVCSKEAFGRLGSHAVGGEYDPFKADQGCLFV